MALKQVTPAKKAIHIIGKMMKDLKPYRATGQNSQPLRRSRNHVATNPFSWLIRLLNRNGKLNNGGDFMKGTIYIELEGYACNMSYKYHPGDNDWDLTKGSYTGSGITMCRATLDIFTRRCRPEIEAAIFQDLMCWKQAA